MKNIDEKNEYLLDSKVPNLVKMMKEIIIGEQAFTISLLQMCKEASFTECRKVLKIILEIKFYEFSSVGSYLCKNNCLFYANARN